MRNPVYSQRWLYRVWALIHFLDCYVFLRPRWLVFAVEVTWLFDQGGVAYKQILLSKASTVGSISIFNLLV